MAYDQHNIFARILRGELPCHRVYENAHTLAFMDLFPQDEGHFLVIPKFPAVTLMELPEEHAVQLIRSVHRLARAAETAFQLPGLMLMQLNGEAAGQTVPHLHFHLIPRQGGGLSSLRRHAGGRADDAALADMARRIAACIEP